MSAILETEGVIPCAAIRNRTHNGYRWFATELDGSHCFVKELGGYADGKYTPVRYLEMRCLPEDLTNGNFEYFAEHGLTNTNPA